MDVKEFATDMMGFAKAAAKSFASNQGDFIPTFVVLRDGGIMPTPFPYYTRDREFHIGMMKSIIAGTEAEAYAFIMEAWFVTPKLDKSKPVDPSNYEQPSKSADRKECLVVQAGSRDGQETVLFVEIKRHGHKLTFDKIVDMTAKEEGKSAMCIISNLFGTETVN